MRLPCVCFETPYTPTGHAYNLIGGWGPFEMIDYAVALGAVRHSTPDSTRCLLTHRAVARERSRTSHQAESPSLRTQEPIITTTMTSTPEEFADLVEYWSGLRIWGPAHRLGYIWGGKLARRGERGRGGSRTPQTWSANAYPGMHSVVRDKQPAQNRHQLCPLCHPFFIQGTAGAMHRPRWDRSASQTRTQSRTS